MIVPHYAPAVTLECALCLRLSSPLPYILHVQQLSCTVLLAAIHLNAQGLDDMTQSMMHVTG